jgi:hypothetical protein
LEVSGVGRTDDEVLEVAARNLLRQRLHGPITRQALPAIAQLDPQEELMVIWIVQHL